MKCRDHQQQNCQVLSHTGHYSFSKPSKLRAKSMPSEWVKGMTLIKKKGKTARVFLGRCLRGRTIPLGMRLQSGSKAVERLQ